MGTKVGSKVHPRSKGIAKWEVEAISKLPKPLHWSDEEGLGEVTYDPKILWLSCLGHEKVLWFAYWIATSNTEGKLKWGQGAPMLEENSLVALLGSAIDQGFFTSTSLKQLNRVIESALKA